MKHAGRCQHGYSAEQVQRGECMSCVAENGGRKDRRERIATAVLAGLYTRPGYGLSPEDSARNALRAADALIAALDAQPDAVRSGT